MKNRYSNKDFLRATSFVQALIIGVVLSASVYGSQQIQPGQKRTVTEGEKLKIKGVILSRDGETFILRDMSRTDTVVRLTDSTKIETERKGLLRKGKSYDVTAILPGLILEAEGNGNSENQLVADKIQFKEDDLRAAVTASVRTAPVEDKTDAALKEIAETNKRISSLDEFEVVKVVTVTFAVNSAALSAAAKKELDDLASKAPGAKNYTVEVQGFTDSTGNAQKNLALSQRRADAVVQYLTVKHNIPLRRITTPMGYGSTKAVADDTSATGRAQNRRVDVRVLVNKGLKQQ